jgi:hypothetical protein
MAVVQIPMGGGMMGIDVPDFAMEATQQDLLSYSQQQVSILSAIATNSGLTVQAIQNTSNQSIANANKNSQAQATNLIGGVKNLLGAGMKVANNAMSSIQQDTTASQFTEKMFETMNFVESAVFGSTKTEGRVELETGREVETPQLWFASSNSKLLIG